MNKMLKRNTVKENLTELSNLEPDEKGVVAYMAGGSLYNRKAIQRLLDMGLTCGTHIRVVNVAPFNGPLALEFRGSRLALDKRLAGNVFIKIDESHSAQQTH